MRKEKRACDFEHCYREAPLLFPSVTCSQVSQWIAPVSNPLCIEKLPLIDHYSDKVWLFCAHGCCTHTLNGRLLQKMIETITILFLLIAKNHFHCNSLHV
jgi:hypothetical protein